MMKRIKRIFLMTQTTQPMASPHPDLPKDFDPALYLELHEDVRLAGVDPAAHYLTYGRVENRPYKKPTVQSFEEALASFLTIPPSDQNAFDLFPNAWSTAFKGVETSGTFNGFDDHRLTWLFNRIDLAGRSVLELGPLEAAHTTMMEQVGAKVLAIESNKGAFLRCLIAKNYLGLSARFLLGDFEKMDLSDKSFDLVLASGVLYHMKDPVALLDSISKASDRLFIWTHYFEPDLSKWNPVLAPLLKDGKWNYKEPDIRSFNGMDVRLVKQHYGEALGWSGFCGGSDVFSNWIYREDLLKLLGLLGYSRIEISFDDLQHRNGPAFCLYCEK